MTKSNTSIFFKFLLDIKKEHLYYLKKLFDARRYAGFSENEYLSFIIRELGYTIHISPKKKLIRIKLI